MTDRDHLATVTELRPTTTKDHDVTTLQHAINALIELDGDLASDRIGDTLRACLGEKYENGNYEHVGNLLVGLLGFAELLLQDFADERGESRESILEQYVALNGAALA